MYMVYLLCRSHVEDVYEHNLYITYTCQDMYHISYICTLWLTIKYILIVFQKCFFCLVLVFDFEYSKLTELPMTMYG